MGWKPCPKPMSAEFANAVTRFTTPIAAMAASAEAPPYAPAATLSATAATLPMPCRHSDGMPPRKMFEK